MRRAARRRGFTLIELLVSLGLLALITAGIAGSLNLGRRVWERAARVEAMQGEGAGLRALRGLLERAERYPQGPATQPLARPMIGSAQELRFLSSLPDASGGQRWIEVRIWVEPSPGGGSERLMLAVSPEGASQPTSPRALLEGVTDLRLTYLGRRPDPSAADESVKAWGPDWSELPYLPTLVAVGFTGPDHRRTELPMAPRLGG